METELSLSIDVRAHLRFFAFLLGNGTLALPILEDVDYLGV